jgi:hypothetical protein
VEKNDEEIECERDLNFGEVEKHFFLRTAPKRYREELLDFVSSIF